MRRTIVFFVGLVMILALAPAAQAAGPPAPPRPPVEISWGLWEGPTEVPAGSWILFHPGWAFASSIEGYLDAMLSEDVSFQMWVDGETMPYRATVTVDPDYCGTTAGGTELCQDTTMLRWEYLSHPLRPGVHTIEFELVFNVDLPDDGYGYDYGAGYTVNESGTLIIVSRR